MKTFNKITINFLVLPLIFIAHTVFANQGNENMITKTITVNVEQSVLWSALTTEEGLAKWWGANVRLEPKLHGEFYEPWGDGQLATGKVIAIAQGQMIQFTWQEKYWKPENLTSCKFSLQENNGTATLTLEHSGWESFPDLTEREKMISGFSKGWDYLLPRLKAYLESL